MKLTIKHQGLPGHFICADRCVFHRTTLITNEANQSILISTVGRMIDIHAEGYPNRRAYTTIGYERYYETQAFVASPCKDCKPSCGLHKIETDKAVNCPLAWQIDHISNTTDALADTMHDNFVKYITKHFHDLYHESFTE